MKITFEKHGNVDVYRFENRGCDYVLKHHKDVDYLHCYSLVTCRKSNPNGGSIRSFENLDDLLKIRTAWVDELVDYVKLKK